MPADDLTTRAPVRAGGVAIIRLSEVTDDILTSEGAVVIVPDDEWGEQVVRLLTEGSATDAR